MNEILRICDKYNYTFSISHNLSVLKWRFSFKTLAGYNEYTYAISDESDCSINMFNDDFFIHLANEFKTFMKENKGVIII